MMLPKIELPVIPEIVASAPTFYAEVSAWIAYIEQQAIPEDAQKTSFVVIKNKFDPNIEGNTIGELLTYAPYLEHNVGEDIRSCPYEGYFIWEPNVNAFAHDILSSENSDNDAYPYLHSSLFSISLVAVRSRYISVCAPSWQRAWRNMKDVPNEFTDYVLQFTDVWKFAKKNENPYELDARITLGLVNGILHAGSSLEEAIVYAVTNKTAQ